MSQGEMGNMRLLQSAAEPLHLMQLLWEEWLKGHEDQGERANNAYEFARWCKGYLSNNRPVRTFPADANLGVVLSNNVQFIISPPAENVKGTMLATPLGDAQRENVPDVYANQGAVPISGNAEKQSGQIDYAQNTKAAFERQGGLGENKTLQTKPEKLDQKGAYSRKL